MNTDELSTLVEIINKMADGGVTALIWILVAKYGTAVLGYIFTSGTIIAVFILLFKMFVRISEAYATVKSIRDLLGVGSSGEMYSQEYRDVLKKIKELLERKP